MEMNKTMAGIIGNSILDLPMRSNDAAASTVRVYLIRLLRAVWHDEEGFDGKRPFGNSGWQDEIYAELVRAGYLDGAFDGNELISYDQEDAEKLVMMAIDAM
jgi:hypothetical protein